MFFSIDFKEFSVIDVEIFNKAISIKKIEKITVDSNIPEKPEIKQIVDSYLDDVNKSLDEVLGRVNTDLDGRTKMVRSQETNLGNFLCDIILNSVAADCALLNGGSLRSDAIHAAGDFTKRDLRNILPYNSELIVVKITGDQLHQLLENCVAKYESLGGSILFNCAFCLNKK